MQLVVAEKKARALMNKHGLNKWGFEFDRATRRLGATWINLCKISLSKKFVELNTWDEVRETMLHEIAHVLSPIDAGHGKRWKETYANIGGNVNRNYANLVSPYKGRALLTGLCPNCGQKTFARRRIKSACRNCCSEYNDGKFSEEYKFIWEK